MEGKRQRGHPRLGMIDHRSVGRSYESMKRRELRDRER